MRGDRLREVVSIALITACILIFPAGLISFVFAPEVIQWTWLGFQIYTITAMHVLRFVNGAMIGTTKSRSARALCDSRSICFRDSEGNNVEAEPNIEVVESLTNGRLRIEKRLRGAQSGDM